MHSFLVKTKMQHKLRISFRRYFKPRRSIKSKYQEGGSSSGSNDKRRCKRAAFTTDEALKVTGRRANVQGLDLDKAGVELTERAISQWIPINKRAYIFAMGDVNGGPQLHSYH